MERFIPGFLTRYPDPFSITRKHGSGAKGLTNASGLSTQRAVQIMNLAGVLIRDHKGQVPLELTHLLELPGVGPYIASAVRCYAFNGIEAPVDTNVARVLVRLHGISPSRYEARRSPEVWKLASELVGQDTETVRQINWALLDLGAQICTAREPKCSKCPLISACHFAAAEKPQGQVSVAKWQTIFGTRSLLFPTIIKNSSSGSKSTLRSASMLQAIYTEMSVYSGMCREWPFKTRR